MSRPRIWARHIIFAAVGVAAILATADGLYRYATHARSPEALLTRADDLAWNNQWLAAGPLYAQAERSFSEEHHRSAALYAHVSQLVAHADSDPIPPLLVELKNDLNLPEAADPETMLRILTIEGMIETNYDAGMARATWRQVQELASKRGHYLLMARAIGEQGIAAFLLGDISSAKKQVLRAWVAAKYLRDPAAHVRYASVYGAGLVELGRYDEALTVLNEAIETASDSAGVAYPSIAINSEIDALRGLHRYEDALHLADEAIHRLPGNNLDAHLFQFLSSKGAIYEEMNDWGAAEVQYQHALEYARYQSYWRGIVQTGGMLATVYEHQNRLVEALSMIDQAIEANTHLPEELYFSPRNLAVKAEILARLGRTEESDWYYQKSFTLIDSLLASVPTPNVERLLITQMKQDYAGYFAFLCLEGHVGEAFHSIEQARGRVEAQALEEHSFALPHAATAEEQKITKLNLELLTTGSRSRRLRLQDALYYAELQVDDSTLVGRTARNPVELQDVQHHLGEDEVVLEYVLNGPESYVLAITREGAHVYKLGSEDTINRLASRYRKVIRNRGTDPTLARSLFDALLSPVHEYQTKHAVIVVPDGETHLLPFAALMDAGGYTLRDHVFSTTPSSTVLSLLRDRAAASQVPPLSYVGVAAWTLTDTLPELHLGSFTPPPDKEPAPLPLSKVEVETIAQQLPRPNTLLLGEDATETRFKALPLERYQVLHLALHGYANVEYPDRSALVFAPSPAGNDDGLLEVREIRTLRLNARLVTLSACNTGVGPIGEVDVANMGNAFVEAGAESVVTSLWDLEDRSTERLMADFYHHLSQHQSEADALRAAQLAIEQAGLAPYYWASFQLVGNPSTRL